MAVEVLRTLSYCGLPPGVAKGHTLGPGALRWLPCRALLTPVLDVDQAVVEEGGESVVDLIPELDFSNSVPKRDIFESQN